MGNFYGASSLHDMKLQDYFDTVTFLAQYAEITSAVKPDATPEEQGIIFPSDSESLGGSKSTEVMATVPADSIKMVAGNRWIQFVPMEGTDNLGEEGKVGYGIKIFHRKSQGLNSQGNNTLLNFGEATQKIEGSNPTTAWTDSMGRYQLEYGRPITLNSITFDPAGHAASASGNETYLLPGLIDGKEPAVYTAFDPTLKKVDFNYLYKLYLRTKSGGTQEDRDTWESWKDKMVKTPFSASVIFDQLAQHETDVDVLMQTVKPMTDKIAGEGFIGLHPAVENLTNQVSILSGQVGNMSDSLGTTYGILNPGQHYTKELEQDEEDRAALSYLSPLGGGSDVIIQAGLNAEVFNQYDASGVAADSPWLTVLNEANGGGNNMAVGQYSHAEGKNTRALGDFAHSEGGYWDWANPSETKINTFPPVAYGDSSHAEGRALIELQPIKTASISVDTSKECSIKINKSSSPTINKLKGKALWDYLQYCYIGINVYAEDLDKDIYKVYPIKSIDGSSDPIKIIIQLGDKEGKSENCESIELYSHVAAGDSSHNEGYGTITKGVASHAEGYQTASIGDYSHSEGFHSKARGIGSHAEGYATTAIGKYSHAEGSAFADEWSNIIQSQAKGDYSHTEGLSTFAEGIASHAEGTMSEAKGAFSHAGGQGTCASSDGEYAIGRYNEIIPNAIFNIGIGTDADHRKTAFAILNNGTFISPYTDNGKTKYFEFNILVDGTIKVEKDGIDYSTS